MNDPTRAHPPSRPSNETRSDTVLSADEPIGVLGAGRLGLAFAGRFAQGGRKVVLWDREAEVRESLRRPDGAEAQGLSPANVTVVDTVAQAAERTRILFVTVPAAGFRTVMQLLGGKARPDHQILHAIKGVGEDFRLMHEIVREETCIQQVGALGGPVLASEIRRFRPQAVVVGTRFDAVEATVRVLLTPDGSQTTWVLGSRDLIGVEVAMAMRNVIAVAEGMIDGLGLGEPARALIAAGGLMEAARLGKALGAQPATFVGVAGVGDLVARRMAGYSRNQAVGLALAQGTPLGRVLEELSARTGASAPPGGAAPEPEGLITAREAARAQQRLKVRLPIAQAVTDVALGAPAQAALAQVLAGLDLGRADSFV